MRKLMTGLAIVLMSLLAGSLASAGEKSLCDLLAGKVGWFQIRYHHMVFDPEYFSNQCPNGGITLELFIRFETVEERDAFADKTKLVRFVNNDSGISYEIGCRKLFYDGPCAVYLITLGRSGHVLGKWDIIVKTKGGRYTANVTLTQEMLEQPPPLPVDPIVIPNFDNSHTVLAQLTEADTLRFRVFDDMGNIIFNQDMNIDEGNGVCFINVPAQYTGYMARIETRFYGEAWPVLMNWGSPETCNSDGMISGSGDSWASVYFKIEVPQD